MSELIRKAEIVAGYWTELTEAQLTAAKDIVKLIRIGDIFKHTIIKRGEIPLYSLQRGTSTKAYGTAEMIEYGAAQFEGDEFSAFSESSIIAAGTRNHLLFPTGHIARYSTDTLRVEQVSGFVDFENPCVETTGNTGSYTQVIKLEAQPVTL